MGESDRRQACPPPAEPVGRRVTTINWLVRYCPADLGGRFVVRHAPVIPGDGVRFRKVHRIDVAGARREAGEEPIRLPDEILRYHGLPPNPRGAGSCNPQAMSTVLHAGHGQSMRLGPRRVVAPPLLVGQKLDRVVRPDVDQREDLVVPGHPRAK